MKLRRLLKSAAARYLKATNLFDIYEGSQIKGGFKSVAYSIAFRAKDRTLGGDGIITPVMEKIFKDLEADGIELRK
ncbi:MAG: hypothetical protein ACLR7D_04305 [Lachnospira eligens]